MSTAEGRLPAQPVFWIFHRHRYWLAMLILGLGSVAIARFALPEGPLAWTIGLIGLSAGIVGMVLDVVASFGTRFHDRPAVICRWCGDEQTRASQRSAESYRRTLWWWHADTLTGLLSIVVGGGTLLLLFLVRSGWVSIVVLLALGFCLWLVHVNRIHRLLRPWCPYCRDFGDGGVPEPSPDTSGSKVRS